jgi:hypothetical protein
MATFFIRASAVAGSHSFFQDGSSKAHAINTVESTGARVLSVIGPLPADAMPDTIAGYWLTHGCSLQEALRMQRDQIAAAIEQEALYDSMENDPF